MTQSPGTTLKSIADEAGVSLTTVSRVLNRNRIGERSDAQRNARRIRAIADRLGYRPNTAARAIQTRRFNAVGLVASTDPSLSVYQPFLEGVTDGCREHDLHLGLGKVVDEKLADNQFVPKILREWAVDGLLIAYMLDFPPMLAQLIEQYRIPSVWLNAKRAHDCVHPDDEGGMHHATAHLLGHGHRRIIYVHTYTGKHFSAADRWTGYARAMREAGLSPNALYPQVTKTVTLNQLHADVRDLLQRDDRPTAFVCYNADQATTVHHAATSLGLSIPRDLSLVGVWYERINTIGCDIATVVIDKQQLGQTAIDLLVRKIDRPSELIAPVVVPHQTDRFDKSTAPPPEAGAG